MKTIELTVMCNNCCTVLNEYEAHEEAVAMQHYNKYKQVCERSEKRMSVGLNWNGTDNNICYRNYKLSWEQ